MYILFFIVAGFFSGFGQSPYDTSLYGIYTNIIHIIGIGIGLEFIRSFLVNNTFNKSPVVAIVSISLLYTLIGTSIGEIISMKSGLDIVNHLGEEFLPELGKNLVASYLVYLGGFLPALLYMTTISMFYNICPVLPDLSWIIKTFLGTIVPFMNLSLINYIYEDEVREIKVNKDEEEGIFGWIITSIGSILIIWFAAGLFTIYPSVIATGSMEPLIYPGDMIILEKIGEEESLVNGDIIQFKRDDILITHRIIDIIEIEESKEIEYVTKGDNNSAKDFETVKKCQIKGKLLRTIPKVGLFTLLLKADKDVDLKSIEF
ncbi:MAG: signal peptidase I [Anaeromicrobium sp.]|jgi:signal peptidase|uniref:signal peptidase I n=1 Tax=Anaeromicrobium sp. TaxID=1929132 RepID=UPI0025D826E6|nr:signal peptidase I [Anaeromicrobium sp.]MCT4593283.1 signal peptidase I [Anaeromicrobium sp.]